MSPQAAELAKLVVTALVKPWDALEKVGHGAIDRLSGWVQGEPKQRYDRLAQEIEQKLAQLPADEIGGPEKLDAALSMAGVLFGENGLTIDELIRQCLNRDEAIEEQTRRFDLRRESRDEPEASICRQHVIPAIFDALFADPDALREIDLAFKRAVLEHLGDIQRLPDESAAALKRLAAQALVRKPYRRFDRDRHAPSALLQAEYAIVPFEGRKEFLDDAIGWCADEHDLGIRLYVGPGGMGKTRVAIELCDQVSVRMPEQGWRSGFLARGFAGVPGWLLPNLRDGREPLLIVVDYAETRPQDLIQLLALAHDLPTGRKLRLLLLARSAGDWWSDLAATPVSDSDGVSDDARAKARALLPGPAVGQPIDLGPLAAEADKRPGIFERALAAFRKHIRHAGAPAPMPDLSGDDFRSVLMIHMAALAAVDGRTVANARDLMEATLQREQVAWARGLVAPSLKAVSAKDVQQAVTLTTLAGGAPNRSAAIEIIGRAPRLESASRALLEDLANVLQGLYPSPLRADEQRDRPIEPLRPDLLGEELVDRTLSDDPELLRAALGQGASRDQVQNGLTVLTRLAQRRPVAERWLEQGLATDLEGLAEPAIQVAIETGSPMGKVLAKVLEAQPPEDPERLELLIPWKTGALLDVGVVVMTQQWNRMLEIPQPWTDENKLTAARIANNLAYRLSEAGRFREALAHAQEASRLYRQLAQNAPEDHFIRASALNFLASALNNLGNRLSDSGDYEAALKATEEAVAIRRELATTEPDGMRPYLAGVLNSLANRLSEVGRFSEAVACAREAVDLYRPLADKAPDAYEPDLAMALNTLAVRLSEVGQSPEALACARKAVHLYRSLADKLPDAFRPGLAKALYILASCFRDVDEPNEALAPSQEAAAHYRELADRVPDVYEPDLALALHALANLFVQAGEPQAALAAAQEASERYRQLADKKPDAFRPDLAMALNTLSVAAALLGRPQEEREAIEEAAELYRQLAEEEPAVYGAEFAMALMNMAECLEANDDLVGATEQNRQAIKAYWPHFHAQPPAFVDQMCKRYVERCEKLGREPDETLLAPIAAVLQEMQEGSGDDAWRYSLCGQVDCPVEPR